LQFLRSRAVLDDDWCIGVDKLHWMRRGPVCERSGDHGVRFVRGGALSFHDGRFGIDELHTMRCGPVLCFCRNHCLHKLRCGTVLNAIRFVRVGKLFKLFWRSLFVEYWPSSCLQSVRHRLLCFKPWANCMHELCRGPVYAHDGRCRVHFLRGGTVPYIDGRIRIGQLYGLFRGSLFFYYRAERGMQQLCDRSVRIEHGDDGMHSLRLGLLRRINGHHSMYELCCGYVFIDDGGVCLHELCWMLCWTVLRNRGNNDVHPMCGRVVLDNGGFVDVDGLHRLRDWIIFVGCGPRYRM
jgi:hypothetical protein